MWVILKSDNLISLLFMIESLILHHLYVGGRKRAKWQLKPHSDQFKIEIKNMLLAGTTRPDV